MNMPIRPITLVLGRLLGLGIAFYVMREVGVVVLPYVLSLTPVLAWQEPSPAQATLRVVAILGITCAGIGIPLLAFYAVLKALWIGVAAAVNRWAPEQKEVTV